MARCALRQQTLRADHGVALVALRRAGYRSDNRSLVFPALAHTVGLAAKKWRVLAKAHEWRISLSRRGMSSAFVVFFSGRLLVWQAVRTYGRQHFAGQKATVKSRSSVISRMA